MEEALQAWFREHARKELERQTEEYYRSMINPSLMREIEKAIQRAIGVTDF